MIVGIDPGKKGGIAAIDRGKVWFARAPLIGKDEDVPKMVEILRALSDAGRGRAASILGEFVGIDDGNFRVAIEACTRAMGKGSVHTAQVQGRIYGEWIGIIQALRLPLIVVHPKTWQNEMLVGHKRETYAERKASARAVAGQLFPSVASLMSVKANDGIADALLIAAFAEFRRSLEPLNESRAT